MVKIRPMLHLAHSLFDKEGAGTSGANRIILDTSQNWRLYIWVVFASICNFSIVFDHRGIVLVVQIKDLIEHRTQKHKT
jgi:hypothetical protein